MASADQSALPPSALNPNQPQPAANNDTSGNNNLNRSAQQQPTHTQQQKSQHPPAHTYFGMPHCDCRLSFGPLTACCSAFFLLPTCCVCL